MKHTLAGFLVAVLLVLALPLVALGSEPPTTAGSYEGEYDANGQRSGYGVWTYANQRYEGQWQNDLPNGEGTLLARFAEDWTADFCVVVQGQWVDGLAEGKILLSNHWRDDAQAAWNVNAFYFEVEKGCARQDIFTTGLLWQDGAEPEEVREVFDPEWLIAGVGPWAEADIDQAVSPPEPGLLTLPGQAEADLIDQKNAAASALGSYEGEYDATGLRSGQGTWTYQNFAYVGQWKSDRPNGQGTLYQAWKSTDGRLEAVDVVQGHWVNGWADGPVWLATYYLKGETSGSKVFYGRLTMGFMREETVVYGVWRDSAGAIEGPADWPVPGGWLLGGVPPWAPMDIDATASLPPLATLDAATWDTAAFLAVIAGEEAKAEALAQYEGTYEGAHDANGRRSGQGTWTYHNFRYVGEWANDLPNGEGTLYEGYQSEGYPSRVTATQGHWVDGHAEGPVLISDHSADGEEFVYSAVVEKGRAPRSMTVEGMSRIHWQAAATLAENMGEAGQAIAEMMEAGFAELDAQIEAMEAEGIAEETIRAQAEEGANRVALAAEGMMMDILATGGEKEKQTVLKETAALLADFDVEYFRQQGMLFDKGDLIAGVPPWAEEPYLEPQCTPPEPDTVGLPPWGYAELIAAAAPENAAETAAADDEGVYEGARDANGLRSGQGTWAYHNLLYVGQWRNDTPNGEGTLYARRVYRDYETQAITGQRDMMIRGRWQDGAVSGAAEVTYLNEDGPLVIRYDRVHEGMFAARWPYALAANARVVCYGWHIPLGQLPPWYVFYLADVDAEVGAPWDLYEKYPQGKPDYAPPEKMANTGLSVTPGNRANGSGMAALGEWIFLSTWQDDVVTLYKMRADGTRLLKLHEHTNGAQAEEYWGAELQVVGDWLYAGYPYKMRADELALTRDESYLFRAADSEGNYENSQGLVAGDWVYQMIGYPPDMLKIALDYTSLTVLGGREQSENPFERGEIIAADEAWVYVYRHGNDESGSYNELFRARTDGTGKAELFTLWRGSEGKCLAFPQVVGGRLYYVEEQLENGHSGGYRLVSAALESGQQPVLTGLSPEGEEIGALHVTADSLYYARLVPGRKTWDIVRADLSGGQPVVLADGFKRVNSILIAGDWLLFKQDDGEAATFSLMRLDGSGLHELGATFVPENAPGLTDSTGKWRYELLPDGSAAILGPGSKLKLAGKLAIPATVDKMPVTAIGANAFYGCENFTGVTIPKTVTSIGDFAFFWCRGLTEVAVPEGVASIGAGAFQGCAKAKKVALPASLTSLGQQAFADCPLVKLSVAKKNEVFEIRDGALFDRVRNAAVE